MDEQFRGARRELAAGVRVGRNTDGARDVVRGTKQATGSERQCIERVASEGDGRRTCDGQRVDRLTAVVHRRIGAEAHIAAGRREGKAARLLDVIHLPHTNAGGRVIDGELKVRRRSGTVKVVHRSPSADHAVGIGVQSSCRSGHIGPGAEHTHGSRGARKVQRCTDAAAKSATEIQGGHPEAAVAGVHTQRIGARRQAQVTEGDRVSSRAAAGVIKRAAIERDCHIVGDAVIHRLNARVVPAQNSIADANARGARKTALINERSLAAHERGIAGELIIIAQTN